MATARRRPETGEEVRTITINEAIQHISRNQMLIARKAWFFPFTLPHLHCPMILPTNDPIGCRIVCNEDDEFLKPWVPSANDLAADDWILCDVNRASKRESTDS